MRSAMLMIVVVALAAGPARAQDDEAKKVYQAMVQKIASAKSLKVVIELQGTPFGASKTADPKFKQTIWIAEGNKVRWAFEQPVGDKLEKNGLLICDGKQLLFQSTTAKLKQDAPAKFSEKLTEGLADHGCWVAIAVLNDALDPDNKPFVRLIPSTFKLGAKEKLGGREVQVLIYLVREKGAKVVDVGTYTVWIDTKTHLPAKVLLDGVAGFRVEETFVEWQLDPKLDAKLFEAPK